MTRLKVLLLWFWRIATRPSAYFSLGFLTLGGFLCGVVFWGGFNTALEITNTEKFCTSCHEMHDTVYQELQRTVHFSNPEHVKEALRRQRWRDPADIEKIAAPPGLEQDRRGNTIPIDQRTRDDREKARGEKPKSD